MKKIASTHFYSMIVVIVFFIFNWPGMNVPASIDADGDCNIITHYDIKQPTCGEDNGVITVSVLGGCAPYSYLWSDSSMHTHSTIMDLVAGTYFLTITDSLGCELNDTIELLDFTELYGPDNSLIYEGPITLDSLAGNSLDFYDFIDYTNDGLSDMVLQEHPSGKIIFHENNGMGFNDGDTLHTPPHVRSPFDRNASRKQTETHYRDFNDDGINDLLVSSANLGNCEQDTIRIYWGNAGAPYYTDSSYMDVFIADRGCVNGFAWDYDNDSDVDVLVDRNENGDDAFVYEWNMDTVSQLGLWVGQPFSTNDIYDYDGDGKLDLMSRVSMMGTTIFGVIHYAGDAAGSYQDVTVHYPFAEPAYHLTLHADPQVDNLYDVVFNGDGDGSDFANLYLAKFDRPNNDWVFDTIVADSAATLMNIIDWDRDGFDDIIVSRPIGTDLHNVDAYINDGSGNFGNPESVVSGVEYTPLKVLDFNDNGLFRIVGKTEENLVVYSLCTEPPLTISPMQICPGDSATVSVIIKDTEGITVTFMLDGEQFGQPSPETSIVTTQLGEYSAILKKGTCEFETNSAELTERMLEIQVASNFICPGQTLTLDASSIGADSYSWNTGSTDPSISISSSGEYTVSAMIGNCELTGVANIEDLSAPVVNSFDIELDCLNDIPVPTPISVLQAEGPASYQWNHGPQGSTVNINLPGEYSVTITNQCGEAIGTFNVTDKCCSCCKFDIPNAFTPNGDGDNDTYMPLFRAGCLYDTYDFKIFNRWGDIVFETDDQNEAWDGMHNSSAAPQDIYVYLLNFSVDGQDITDSGDVLIIR